MFRPTLARLATKPIPASSIPQSQRVLPTKPSPSTSASKNQTSSPTIDGLLQNLASKRSKRLHSTGLSGDGRGLTNAVGEQVEMEVQSLDGIELPPNLRIEEYVPKRTEYVGVKEKHRELLKRLTREA